MSADATWFHKGRIECAFSVGTMPAYQHSSCGYVWIGSDPPARCPMCELEGRVRELERTHA